MKPEIRRLKTRPDYLRVAAARRKAVTPGFVLQAARSPAGAGRVAQRSRAGERAAAMPCGGPDVIRVGFTASRKVGKAVARNRARRRLRAVAARVLPEAGQCGYDYVLVARAGTLNRRYVDLVADLRFALAGLGKEKTPPHSRTGRRGRAAGRPAKHGGGERS